MTLLLELTIVFTVVAVLCAGFVLWPAYLRRHPEKRGGKSAVGGLVGGTDFVWHPEAANAATELDEQQRLVVPAPTPDDDKGMADGRIRIEL
jgi:hypothetical protein